MLLIGKNIKKIYFIGIKGVAVAGLAIMSKELGYEVGGSDVEEVFITDELLKKNNISTSNLNKLDVLLPDRIDSVRFIYDLDTIANIHNKTLFEVGLDEIVGDLFTSTVVTFSINGTYDELIAFISDLERSLRIVDIQGISFKVTNIADTEGIDYTIVIATHTLK